MYVVHIHVSGWNKCVTFSEEDWIIKSDTISIIFIKITAYTKDRISIYIYIYIYIYPSNVLVYVFSINSDIVQKNEKIVWIAIYNTIVCYDSQRHTLISSESGLLQRLLFFPLSVCTMERNKQIKTQCCIYLNTNTL